MDKLVVHAALERLRYVVGFVETAVKAAGCKKEDLDKILVSVDELFTNIAQYAYGEGGGEWRNRFGNSGRFLRSLYQAAFSVKRTPTSH